VFHTSSPHKVARDGKGAQEAILAACLAALPALSLSLFFFSLLLAAACCFCSTALFGCVECKIFYIVGYDAHARSTCFLIAFAAS